MGLLFFCCCFVFSLVIVLVHLFQNFKLTEDMKPLFSVEVVEGRSKSKDHLAVVKGEQLSVFVTSHPKLPQGKFIVEKGDGTCEPRPAIIQ